MILATLPPIEWGDVAGGHPKEQARRLLHQY